ncbi:MDR family MFS transporter [Vagococcus xieshaowenii]|uniref:DHA2 family efflux MFS transporter permease subunit n=1 Tax=Vagococcus xieshaowenii TaxID=2562451 RepID=A0AAJ5JQH9_9ENTE|nr:MDR family MFS transporter [Vagococcus xieshaowenii]QCA29067.1 DHA2 family efflux MFS transporter permease subunit [Vagococcus xieshaowenii]TFZ40957.1 DHA2 family efflux MFS transporter permease subunit [Vagococcus xieshaowenii]
MSKQETLDIHGKPYNRGLLVAVLLIGSFCTVLNQTLLATATPKLMDAFSIGANDVQWLTTGFLLINGMMIPITGWLINRFPSKNLYLAAMIIFLVGTFACFIAPNFSILLAGRLIQAMGVGISMPLQQNIMFSIFPPEKRGAAMGMSGIVIGLAPAIGPTLSGWIVDNYSWRVLFGMMLPISTIVVVLSFFLMKNVLEVSKSKIDFSSIILSCIAFGTMLYGFSSVGSRGWGDSLVLGCIAIGIIFLAIFSLRQLKMDEPFLELRVFKSKIFTVTTVLSGLVMMAMIGAEMVLPMYIQNIRGETAFNSGLMLLPGALVMGFMMPITGKIFDKQGAKRLTILGMFILALSTLPFAFLTAETPLTYIIVLYGIRMFAISMAMMPLTTEGLNALPHHQISHGTAVNSTFRQVASSIGTAVLISVLSNVTANNMPKESMVDKTPLAYKDQVIDALLSGYHSAFFIAVIFAVIGCLISFMLNAKPKTVVGGKA